MSSEPGWVRAPRERAVRYFERVRESERRSAGITVTDAARQAGISEEAMREALTGMARMQMHDGQLYVSQDDLNRLAASGAIPRPSAVRAADADPFGSAPDPELDRRVAAVAEEIGLDIGTGKPATEEETPEAPEPEPDPFAPAVDPAVEARTAELAQQLGLDAAPVERKQPAPISEATTRRITAAKHSGHRLGQPRRWSEH